jgi:hypothetical protein
MLLLPITTADNTENLLHREFNLYWKICMEIHTELTNQLSGTLPNMVCILHIANQVFETMRCFTLKKPSPSVLIVVSLTSALIVMVTV